MRRTTTPDETGWYWIEADGDWCMAYLDCDGDPPKLLVCDAPNRSFEVRRAVTPGLWFGPLTCPGGDFGGAIYEFDADLHDQAEREGKAMLMTVADLTHAGPHGGTICSAGLMEREAAVKAVAAAFDRLDGDEATATRGDSK